MHTITGWGFPVTVEQMRALAQAMGEQTLFARTGGAPSLAVGMASIFGSTFGQGLLGALVPLRDHVRGGVPPGARSMRARASAGSCCRICSGTSGRRWGAPPGIPSVIFASASMVAGWGYFLYVGVIDPNGGMNILWPLFGISNQMLAAIALSVATGILIKSARPATRSVTLVPLAWLAIVTTHRRVAKDYKSRCQDRPAGRRPTTWPASSPPACCRPRRPRWRRS